MRVHMVAIQDKHAKHDGTQVFSWRWHHHIIFPRPSRYSNDDPDKQLHSLTEYMATTLPRVCCQNTLPGWTSSTLVTLCKGILETSQTTSIAKDPTFQNMMEHSEHV